MARQKAPSVGFKELILIPVTYPLVAVIVMWAVQVGADELGLKISHYGLKPRDWKGLLGIFTMPFIHGSYEHLINNSMPMLVLGWALFKFYPTVAWKALLGIWFIGGLWLWISGRDAFHIGASGVVYGLASFLFLSGWLRKEKGVAALSLVIVFVYGGLWWGVLPVNPEMSWEGHLWGAIAGFAMAWHLRKQGPQRPLYQWEIDEIEEKKREAQIALIIEDIAYEEITDEGENIDPQKTPHQNEIQRGGNYSNVSKIQYDFKPKPPKGES